MAIVGKEDEDDVAAASAAAIANGKPLTAKDKRRIAEQAPKKKSIAYAGEYTTSVDIAADPVVPYMTPDELQRSINRLREQMLQAAKEMEFIEAARLRDEIIKLEAKLETMRSAK